MLTIRCVWGLCLSLILAGCATTGASTAGAPPIDTAQTQAVDAYRIGVDDQVQVAVWRNPELGITVPVRPDGMISVPLIGDVLAGAARHRKSPRTSRTSCRRTCATRRSR